MVSVSLVFTFILSTYLAHLNSARVERYNYTCEPFECADLGSMRFPYKDTVQPGNCGLFTMNCRTRTIQFKEGGHWYKVACINQSDSYPFAINDSALYEEADSHGCESLESFGLPSNNIANVSSKYMVRVFKCNSSLHNINLPTDFHNTSCGDYTIYYTSTNPSNDYSGLAQDRCSFIQLPATDLNTLEAPYSQTNFCSLFSGILSLQVHVNNVCVECQNQGHQCLFNDENQDYYCSSSEKASKKVVRVAAIASAGGALVLVVLICCLTRKILAYKVIYLWKKPNQAHQKVENFLKEYGHIPTKRYSYLDVKKITNSFTKKIGQGGYGCVYKGKLPNGQLAAVKVLNKSKGNGEEFINEVATISRTSHVNIVSLLGFCFEGSKRALIYEFMHNGSLDKFIFEQNQNQIENHNYLEWETLHQISLGIARGLEYLHRGCNTRILHFDIKPHNILLDTDFIPKISDFGLAKVCTREESIISMLEARGTAGYIAPEIFCRSFGGVSQKSDVYSYGMMVLEMVGRRKNVNAGADHTSEIYFPHWIYKRIELDEDLGLARIANEDDETKVRKMIMVSLWCIQTDPPNRPTMSKVIEMPEGSLNSIQVPPKP